jgi:hypothetical protein
VSFTKATNKLHVSVAGTGDVVTTKKLGFVFVETVDDYIVFARDDGVRDG